MTKTEAKGELQSIINELVNVGCCTFWACPGPNRPIVEGVTCRVCYQIKRLRELKRNL